MSWPSRNPMSRIDLTLLIEWAEVTPRAASSTLEQFLGLEFGHQAGYAFDNEIVLTVPDRVRLCSETPQEPCKEPCNGMHNDSIIMPPPERHVRKSCPVQSTHMTIDPQSDIQCLLHLATHS